ncbi:lipopolysaccharide biosynthesis protein [Halalkalibacter okhensis]|uniref:lipopolysaccharide biosynthesis protein n=1 Tax=Halalkalibacter okhensis TaxID=333138 RepID=UPI001377CCD0|nr:polysaccharide biosynthesis C-terminal domain-containing protein [Halalkalibacter okhensis]
MIKDTQIYAIAMFGPQLINFLLLPLFTSYFSTAEYGQWDLIVVTVSLLLPFISFEILTSVYRWLLEEKDFNKRKEIISTGFFYTIRNLTLFCFLAIFVMIYFNIEYQFLIIMMIIFNILNNFIQKCARGLGLNKQFAILGITQTIVTLVTQMLCVFVFQIRIETFFIGAIVGNASSFLLGCYMLKFHQYLAINYFSKQLSESLLKYSIPIIPGAVSFWVMNSSDRFIISAFLGLSANGIYSVANKLPVLINMVKSIFQLAWQDSAILSYKDQDRDQYYSEIFKRYFRFLMPSCTILITLTPFLMKLIVADHFYIAWKYTAILFLGAVFLALSDFWGAAYHGSKNTKVILKTTLIGAMVNIIVNLLLIQLIGLYAAAISTVVGFFVMWLIRMKSKSKTFEIDIDKKDFIILFSILVSFLILTYLENVVINAVLVLMSLALFYLYNKDVLSKLFKFLVAKVKK